MNLIECWKQAKLGQKIKSGFCVIEKNEFTSLLTEAINSMPVETLLADDWEIVKEEKTVVIEGAWGTCCYDCLAMRTYWNAHCKEKLPAKGTTIKHTLEWDE